MAFSDIVLFTSYISFDGDLATLFFFFFPPQNSLPRGGKRSLTSLVSPSQRGRDPDANRFATSCLVDPRQPLPSPRLIVNTLGPDADADLDDRHTAMFTQFGQLLVHDISLTAGGRSVMGIDKWEEKKKKKKHLIPPILYVCTIPGNRRRPIGDCCKDDSSDDCYPIRIPDGDPIFPDKCNRNFLRFCVCGRTLFWGCPLRFQLLFSILFRVHNYNTRSGQFCRKPFSAREQMNSITSFVDGSSIYGSTGNANKRLRSRSGGGLMRANARSGAELLPSAGAGDLRSGAQPTLQAIHTVFLREHNRIARALAGAFGDDDDERIFQEARRLVVAQFQNVVFNEYMPAVLGAERARDAGVSILAGRSKYVGAVGRGKGQVLRMLGR